MFVPPRYCLKDTLLSEQDTLTGRTFFCFLTLNCRTFIVLERPLYLLSSAEGEQYLVKGL